MASLKELYAAPGVVDLRPAEARRHFAMALRAEDEGKREAAEDLLKQAVQECSG